MFDHIQQILKQQNILFHLNQGITLATVENLHDGFALAEAILYKIVDSRTVLYLSGGRTPKVLYERLAKDELLLPGVVAMVDEKFGPKFHDKSNEKMLQETGLLRYFQMRNIPFYPILQRHSVISSDSKKSQEISPHFTRRDDKEREQTAESYDEQLRTLNAMYQKSVAFLGVGADGHTALIAGERKDFHNPLFDNERKTLLVSEFSDENGPYGERITMTFLGLSMVDINLVLVFGEEKKKALELLFTDGSETEIPARFFKRPEITKKTLFITDQRI